MPLAAAAVVEVSTTEPVVGLHSPVYVNRALLDECQAEFQKLLIRHSLGDRISPLEKLALAVLLANDIHPPTTGEQTK